MTPSRRNFLALGGAALLAPGVPMRALSADRPVRIAFFTDIHARVEWETPEALRRAAFAINALKPDFAVCGGDCATDGYIHSAADMAPRWDAYMEQLHSRLDMPVETVFGNHDLTGVRLPGGIAPEPDPRALFLKRLGLQRTWRHADHAGIRLILLDSVEVLAADAPEPYRGWISAAQLEWLDGVLAQSPKEQPFIVATHIPLLSAYVQATQGALEPLTPGRGVGNNLEILRRFEGRRLLAVLQGHLHVNECVTWRGVPHITGGAVCGKWWRGDWQGTEAGFGLLTVQPDTGRVDWEYHPLGWEPRRPAGQ